MDGVRMPLARNGNARSRDGPPTAKL